MLPHTKLYTQAIQRHLLKYLPMLTAESIAEKTVDDNIGNDI